MKLHLMRDGWRRVILAVPTCFTLAALCFGISAVREAFRGDFKYACVCIMVSAVFDGLDGHVARYLDAVTLFGGELDSLCDLVDFGLTPALVLYVWAQEKYATSHVPATNAFWCCCLTYIGACALRLARFNVGSLYSPTVARKSSYAAEHMDGEPSVRRYPNHFYSSYITRSKFFQVARPSLVLAHLLTRPLPVPPHHLSVSFRCPLHTPRTRR